MPLLPPILGLDSWSLIEHLVVSEGVRTGVDRSRWS